jgi:Domain of unknown function (DUF5615)
VSSPGFERLKFYFDENSGHGDRVHALRAAGYEALTAADAGMLGRSDLAHLEFAAASGLVIVTEDISDFSVLHTRYIESNRVHGGIIAVHQSRGLGPGAFVLGIEALVTRLDGQPMANRFEYLPRIAPLAGD